MRLLRGLHLLPWLVVACAPFGADVAPAPAPEASAAAGAIADRIARDVVYLGDSTLALRFDPPPIYATWRAEVERCSGFTRAGWPTLYIAQTVTLTDSAWLALYVVPSRRVVFGLGYEAVAYVVRHEFLHDLLGVAAHAPEFFEQRCRALVNPGRSP